MSKKMLRLVILLVAIAVLGGVYGVMYVNNQKKAEQEALEAEESENGILIKEMDEDSIVGFSFQHANDDAFSDEKWVFSKQGETWYYKDDLNFPVSTTMIDLLTEDLSAVYANRVLEETDENFATYGLDEPSLIISVTDGKETVTYNIGDYNEATADYYMYMDGDSTVYTVDGTLYADFCVELYDMVDMEDFPTIDADYITHINVNYEGNELDLTFERTSQEEDEDGNVVIEGTWYVMNEDGELVDADQTMCATLASSCVNMTFLQEFDYNYDEEDLAGYGLDDPMLVITVDYSYFEIDEDSVESVEVDENLNEYEYELIETQKQMVVTVGDATNAYLTTTDYYTILSDSTAVMSMDETVLETFMSLDVNNFISNLSSYGSSTEESEE